MNMNDKLGLFSRNFGNPFIVGSLESHKLIFVNAVAEKLFGMDVETFDLSKIFNKSPENIETLMKKSLNMPQPALFYNHTALTGNNEKIIVDLKVGFFNEEKTEVFLELIPQRDMRFEMALYQVNHSSRPEAILNFDEKLSIVHCNDPFHQVFESSEELRHSHFKNDLVNGFLPEVRDKLLCNIVQKLSISKIYATKIKINTATGEERWYFLELERRTLDNSGTDKIMVYMINIEKQVELEEEYSQQVQYFKALQELTKDVLYRVEMPSKTLYHTLKEGIGKKYGLVIPNHVDFFIENKIIHPDDAKKYIEQLQQFISEEGQVSEIPLRIALHTEEYQWCTIKGKKIFGSDGELTEIIGAILNIDEKYHMEERYSTLNQYFTAMQELTKDKLFHIDIETKTFFHNDENAMDFGVPAEISDYVNFMVNNNLIYHEDVERFRSYTEKLFQGENTEIEVRSAVDLGVYEWFHIKSRYIRDKEGNIEEIFGKMENIQKQREWDLELRTGREPMTDVLDKNSFEKEVIRVLDTSTTEQRHVLICIDLDHFKGINDEFGDSFGDFLLTTVTMRLKNLVRATDLVGRIGEDEFSIFLQDVGEKGSVEERAKIFAESLNRAFSFEDKVAKINVSIGISLFPKHGNNYHVLHEKADQAVRDSKAKGENLTTLYV